MRVPSTDGVTLELHDLGGEGPTVLIAHATGFCAGAYEPFAARLASHGHHVWAVDFRAHGDSTTPASGDLNWGGMADDVLAVAAALDDGPLLAYGHSMGGAALAAAELRQPGTLARAVLFEPIIVPTGWATMLDGDNPLAAAARRRRPTFASRPEALARYAGRPPLGAFRADVLSAYVEHGFAEQADGTITLKCTPTHEGDVFDAPGKPTNGSLAPITTPILVTMGMRDAGRGPTDFAPAVAEALAHGSAHPYHHVGHFGPFQDPDTLADDAATFFAAT